MAEPFDPYYSWLAIPLREQPPNHYRLLGTSLFEQNPDVIEAAADRQMGHVRSFQAGKHSALSQKLLNEIAAAKICLLQPDKKAAYDATLRASLQADPTPLQMPEQRSEAVRAEMPGRWLLPGASIGLLVAVALMVWTTARHRREVVQAEPSAIESRWISEPVSEPQAVPEKEVAAPAPETKPSATAASQGVAAVPERNTLAVARETMEAGLPGHATAPNRPVTMISSPPVARPVPPAAQPVAAPTAVSVAGTSRQELELTERSEAVALVPDTGFPPRKSGSPLVPTIPAPKKRPRPDAATLTKAAKSVQELYQAEYGKCKILSEKQALARRIYNSGLRINDDPAGRFALFQMSREISAAVGDGEAALQAVDRLADTFEVDPVSMKCDILTGLTKGGRSPEFRTTTVGLALKVVDEAIARDDFTAADTLLKLALTEAMKSRNKDATHEVRRSRKLYEEALKTFGPMKVARARLADSPQDPEANLAAGKYACLIKGDWEAGLKLLALGSDETLKTLAQRERAGPIDADAQAAIADAWWSYGSGKSGLAKTHIDEHTADWYLSAVAGLSGVAKARVEKRLAELKLPPQRVSKRIVNPVDSSILVLVPAGPFLAGRMKFEVNLPAFYMALHPVTNAQYKRFVDATGHRPPQAGWPSDEPAGHKPNAAWEGNSYRPELADHPVTCVTWDDTNAYCSWAGLRLPTALEWEKAARGTDGRMYPWGDQWDASKCRNASNRGAERTCSVVEYPTGASPLGILHMVGNVSVWLFDSPDDEAYARYGRGDLTPPAETNARLIVGGGWRSPNPLRCALDGRGGQSRGIGFDDVGFRVAKSVGP